MTALAVTPEQTDMSGQFLSFSLGKETYGIEILRVQEIRGWESVRPLPDVPDYVKGVLDLRGTIVPIVDLRIRFGNPDPEYLPTTVMIIVAVRNGDDSHQLVGVVVDGVSDVLDAGETEVKPPPRLQGSISQKYVSGMISLPSAMVVLVDIDHMLSDAELAELEALSD